jgi:GH24 family phage-related lysozyme (muramidase)
MSKQRDNSVSPEIRLSILAALLAALAVLAGCAGAPHTPPRQHLPSRQPASTTISAQIAACTSPHALEPPCTAIVPEGASGLGSRFVEGPLAVTLLYSEIQLDTFGGELTAAFENVRKAWYCPEPDPAYGWAIPTRGFGETGGITRSSPCISYATAVRNLRYLMDADYLPPVRALGVNFSHDQVDALGDLLWNCGSGVLGSFAYLLRAHDWAAAGAFILRYSYANGEFLPGLYARRVREDHLLQITERPKPPETPTQRHTRLKRALAGDEHALVGLRVRIKVLRHVLLVDGCDERRNHRRRLGPRCARWFKEGADDHLRGRQLDGQVARYHREGV